MSPFSGGMRNQGRILSRMAAIPDLAALVRAGGASFTAGYAHRLEQGACPFHHHAGFEIVHHRSGHGRSRLADGPELGFAAGDVVVYAPQQSHDQTQEAAGEDACVHISVRGPMPRALPAYFHVPAVADGWLRRELHELSDRPSATGELERLSLDLRAGALLVRLLAEAETAVQATAPASAGDAHAELADRYIGERFRDIGRLEDVATHLGIGYDHLRHVYRRRYGRSLVRRLIEARIERAKVLLRHAPIPVSGVAAEVGYATARHFSEVFRTVAGCTPGAFREAGTVGRS